MTNQKTVLNFDAVVEAVKETKKHDGNGNPRYALSYDLILESGYELSKVPAASKNQGMRNNRKTQTVSFQSFNLVATLTDFFKEIA